MSTLGEIYDSLVDFQKGQPLFLESELARINYSILAPITDSLLVGKIIRSLIYRPFVFEDSLSERFLNFSLPNPEQENIYYLFDNDQPLVERGLIRLDDSIRRNYIISGYLQSLNFSSPTFIHHYTILPPETYVQPGDLFRKTKKKDPRTTILFQSYSHLNSLYLSQDEFWENTTVPELADILLDLSNLISQIARVTNNKLIIGKLDPEKLLVSRSHDISVINRTRENSRVFLADYIDWYGEIGWNGERYELPPVSEHDRYEGMVERNPLAPLIFYFLDRIKPPARIGLMAKFTAFLNDLVKYITRTIPGDTLQRTNISLLEFSEESNIFIPLHPALLSELEVEPTPVYLDSIGYEPPLSYVRLIYGGATLENYPEVQDDIEETLDYLKREIDSADKMWSKLWRLAQFSSMWRILNIIDPDSTETAFLRERILRYYTKLPQVPGRDIILSS